MKTIISFFSGLMMLSLILNTPVRVYSQNDQAELQAAQMEKQKAQMEMEQAEMFHQQMKLEQQKERIEAQRVAFITDRLELTPAEAQVFWPVYNEYDKKRHELNKNFRRPEGERKDIDSMTDKEAMEIAEDQLVEAQKMLDLRKEYHGKLKKVLPPKKLLKLYESEREFQKHLIDRLREDRGNRPGQAPGGKKGGRK